MKSRAPLFAALRPAYEQALTALQIAPTADFAALVRAELTPLPVSACQASPTFQQLRDLYEWRARYLDWELGTGYVGFFSAHPGTRYTFTRRIEIIRQLLPDITPDTRILEIGCGAGLLCFDLAPHAQAVVGVDVSTLVLRVAKTVNTALHGQNIFFCAGAAEALSFPDAAFDLVICS